MWYRTRQCTQSARRSWSWSILPIEISMAWWVERWRMLPVDWGFRGKLIEVEEAGCKYDTLTKLHFFMDSVTPLGTVFERIQNYLVQEATLELFDKESVLCEVDPGKVDTWQPPRYFEGRSRQVRLRRLSWTTKTNTLHIFQTTSSALSAIWLLRWIVWWVYDRETAMRFRTVFKEVAEKLTSMFRRKAFLHWYTAEGCTKWMWPKLSGRLMIWWARTSLAVGMECIMGSSMRRKKTSTLGISIEEKGLLWYKWLTCQVISYVSVPSQCLDKMNYSGLLSFIGSLGYLLLPSFLVPFSALFVPSGPVPLVLWSWSLSFFFPFRFSFSFLLTRHSPPSVI